MSQKQTHNTKPNQDTTSTLHPSTLPSSTNHSPPLNLPPPPPPPPHQATLNSHTHYVYPERHYFNQSKQKTALMKTTTTIPLTLTLTLARNQQHNPNYQPAEHDCYTPSKTPSHLARP